MAESGVFFFMLIAQGCIIISNQKSLPVYAALIHTAFHTYTLLSPLGQAGSLMDSYPRSTDRAASFTFSHTDDLQSEQTFNYLMKQVQN